MRQGAFARRLVIEIRQDSAEEGIGTFTVTDSGRAATQASVGLGYADGERVYQEPSGAIPEFRALRSATVHLSGTKAQELKVWVHRMTPEGYSENLSALLKVSSGKEIQEFHMVRAGKQCVFPLREVMKTEHKAGADETTQLTVKVQLAGSTMIDRSHD